MPLKAPAPSVLFDGQPDFNRKKYFTKGLRTLGKPPDLGLQDHWCFKDARP